MPLIGKGLISIRFILGDTKGFRKISMLLTRRHSLGVVSEYGTSQDGFSREDEKEKKVKTTFVEMSL